jgi:hypothetical protein
VARYDSLLLRIWSREGAEGERWISQVEHVQTGTTLRFSDREALLAYLSMIVGRRDSARLPVDQPTQCRLPESDGPLS